MHESPATIAVRVRVRVRVRARVRVRVRVRVRARVTNPNPNPNPMHESPRTIAAAPMSCAAVGHSPSTSTWCD